jgi:hypothetical protein
LLCCIKRPSRSTTADLPAEIDVALMLTSRTGGKSELLVRREAG